MPEPLISINRDEIERPAFRMALEAAPNGQLIVDSKGLITFTNRTLAKMFAYESQELLGKTVEHLIPERFRQHHPQHRGGFFKAPQTRAMGAGRDLFGVKKNGEEFPVEIGLNPLITNEETLVLATIIDITERKKNEAIIAAKNRELETLLYITSHDLREPLRAIQNFSHMLHDEYQDKLDDAAKDYLMRVVNGSNRMNNLLNDVLTLSRSKNMGQPSELCDCESIVRVVLERLQENIERTRAKITVTPGLPFIRADKSWTEHALFNLISNALKFTLKDQAPDIEITPYIPDRQKYPSETGIAVKDRGIGVPEQYRERIFGLFQRAVPRSIEGTGAGLAIVRSVAEQHGGHAWVEPREGGGSIFVITFPKS